MGLTQEQVKRDHRKEHKEEFGVGRNAKEGKRGGHKNVHHPTGYGPWVISGIVCGWHQ